MRIEYQLTKEEFIDGLDSHICRTGSGVTRLLTALGYAILLVTAGAFVISQLRTPEAAALLASGDMGAIFGMLVPGVLVLAAIAAAIWYSGQSQSKAKRSFATMVRKKRVPQSYIGPHAIEVEGTEVTLTYGAAGRRYSCAEVDAEADDRHGGVLLFLDAALLDVLPASAFPGADDRAAFLACFQTAKAAANAATWGGVLEGRDAERAAAKLALDYNWDRAGYPDAVNSANHIWFRSKLYWTPGRMALAALAAVALLAGVVCAILGLTAGAGAVVWFLPAFVLLCAAVGLGVSTLLPAGNWGKRSTRNRILSGSLPADTLGPQLFCLTDDGVTVYRRESRHDLRRSEIRGALSGADGMVVLVADHDRLLFLPGSAFPDQTTREKLLEDLDPTNTKENMTV